MNELKKNEAFGGPEGSVVLVIMDGVGIGKNPESDYVKIANTPNLDWLRENAMPDDSDMGNSEVGHNAIGCGRVFEQGAALVGAAIASESMFKDAVWKELVANVNDKGSALHFIGLFSDGNVHSNINHLEAMLNRAKAEGAKKVRIHPLIDGRDVPPTSVLEYVERFDKFLEGINADLRAGIRGTF